MRALFKVKSNIILLFIKKKSGTFDDVFLTWSLSNILFHLTEDVIFLHQKTFLSERLTSYEGCYILRKFRYIYSFIYSYIYSFIYSYIYSFIYSYTYSFIYSYIYSFIYSYIYTFIYSYIYSFIYSYIYLYIYSRHIKRYQRKQPEMYLQLLEYLREVFVINSSR